MTNKKEKEILWLKEVNFDDLLLVGGKNASLGEMKQNLSKEGINIPDGFVLTTNFYWRFLRENKIDKKLKDLFKKYNPKSIQSLQETGEKARKLILNGEFSKDFKEKLFSAYENLEKKYGKNVAVAVRSSGVCEDMPKASFAGQFESYLNVRGKKNLMIAVKNCIASVFNDRVIAYRADKNIDQLKFGLSVGVIKMVRSDIGSSGVMFTLDTETGFPNVVLINSIWGLGEMIVKGRITPDEFVVFKKTLEKNNYKPIIKKSLGRKTVKYIYGKKGGIKEVKVPKNKQLQFSLEDNDILKLAKWGTIIENYYSKKYNKWSPQDIEWAKDGKTGELFIIQSRPETVHASKIGRVYEEYRIKSKRKPILTGIAVGNKIGVGKAHIIENVSKISEFKKGEVLVTRMTDPDWVSIFPLASAIVTEEGGPTCHAAIVSRELNIPCIVGVKESLKTLKTGKTITVDCTQGRLGRIFLGKVPFEIKRYDLKKLPKLKTKIMVNIGAPEIAFKSSFLPNQGVGLAREEFIIAEKIRIHPLALYYFNKLKDKKLKEKIEKLTIGYKNKRNFYIDKLAEGIAQIASSFYPKPVIVRFSDFKTNEYKNLIGGELFEPEEDNPMLGWRGAARYYDEKFKPAFEMEIEAIKKARNVFGLKNIMVMIPFCRTIEEGKKVLEILRKNGLKRGKDGLEIYVMCEIPSNVILVDKFLDIFDGMSIGSNDLTQLTLGLDRDNGKIAHIGNENNKAVKEEIKKVIKTCRERGKYVGICGQAPSDYLDFAQFLIDQGIESISLNPDSILKTIIKLAKKK